MAHDRSALRVQTAEKRPAVVAPPSRAAASAVGQSPASALRQRIGNQATQAVLAGVATPAATRAVAGTTTALGAEPAATQAAATGRAGSVSAPGKDVASAAQAAPAAKADVAANARGPGSSGAAPAAAPGAPKAGGPAVAGKAADAATPVRPGGAPEAAAAMPPPPSPREAIGPAAGAVRHRAAAARQHAPAGAAVASAQASAVRPHTEQVRGAAAQTVGAMDAAKADAVRRGEFKAKLKKAIQDATPQPKSEAEANRVMKEGGAQASGALRGQLSAERDAAAGPMKSAAATEAPASDQPVPPETALQVQAPGPAPAPVSAAPVVPAPMPAQRLDYSADHAPTEKVMAESNVTPEQLKKGNDPAFGPALDAQATAQKHEAKAEAAYRGQESKVQADARAGAQGALAQGLGGIHGSRVAQLGQVGELQHGTAAKDAAQRQQITADITAIKDKTKADVEKILESLDTEAAGIFERGLKRAETSYDAAFEDAKGGIGTWLTTWGSDWDKHIAGALGTARSEYMRQVDSAIDEVADFVDRKVKEAKDRVASGRKAVDERVAGLGANLRQFGEEARDAVSGDFDTMAAEIDERRDALVDKLVQQYKDSYERMSAREEELREANKSLWQRAYDATVGLIKKIIAFKDMLLGLLGRVAGVVNDIIADPIGFLGNLVSGVMAGLKNFMSNIGSHLKKGLMDWLFGALAGAGLQLPDTFDLKGILSIVLQILGLTYANFRARAVAIVGEPVVGALEQAAEVFKILLTEGVGGLWRFIKDKVADLKSMVLDAIFDFIKEKVIIAGVTWIIGLLNPASAFFKACKAIYDIVMFFVNRGSQILSLVNAIVDSMAAIVKGNISVAATFVENALAKAVPVAIGFLASLLGLGDPSKPVKNTIEKAQSPVNKAIDWVIHQAVKFVKAAGSLVKGMFGKKMDKNEKTGHEDDPKKAAKIEAGLATLNQRMLAREKDGKLAKAAADEIAIEVRKKHPVFSAITVEDSGESWAFSYAASAKKKGPAAKKAETDGVLEVSVVDSKPPRGSKVGALDIGKPTGWGYDPSDPYGGKGSPKVFEEKVGQAVAKATSQSLAKKGPKGKLPDTAENDELVREPKAGVFGKQPDFVAFVGGQIEVFEATLDAKFEIGTVTDEKQLSHKRIQLAGTVVGLARLYPGVPIVFNIVTHQPLGELRGKLERELKTLRAQLAHERLRNRIQIIWRS
jgi:hypothetical protein